VFIMTTLQLRRSKKIRALWSWKLN
jgi:hypothetical protein